MSSFLFSKVFSECGKYFEIKEQDKASSQDDDEDVGEHHSAAHESSVTQSGKLTLLIV